MLQAEMPSLTKNGKKLTIRKLSIFCNRVENRKNSRLSDKTQINIVANQISEDMIQTEVARKNSSDNDEIDANQRRRPNAVESIYNEGDQTKKYTSTTLTFQVEGAVTATPLDLNTVGTAFASYGRVSGDNHKRMQSESNSEQDNNDDNSDNNDSEDDAKAAHTEI